MEDYSPPPAQTIGEAYAAKMDGEARNRPLDRWSWRRGFTSALIYLALFAMGLGVLWWMDTSGSDDTEPVPGSTAVVQESPLATP